MSEKKPVSAKRPFLSGYGEGYFVAPDVTRPPEIEHANQQTWLWMKYYFVFGFVLAFLLPEDILTTLPLLSSYADLLARFIPFIDWVADASTRPQVIRLWYAVMWPCLLILPVRYMSLYAFRHLPAMARRMGFWRHLVTASGGVLISGMLYGLMISAEMMPAKSYSMGHGRLMLALITDYRTGLAIFAPTLMLVQFVTYLGSLFLVLALFARFFYRENLS